MSKFEELIQLLNQAMIVEEFTEVVEAGEYALAQGKITQNEYYDLKIYINKATKRIVYWAGSLENLHVKWDWSGDIIKND